MTRIQIHEDDEGMRNLYPATALPQVQQDIAAAHMNATENQTPNATGWTDVHVIGEPTTGYRAFNIKAKNMSAKLETVLPRVQNFQVGGSKNNPFFRHEKQPFCFGFGPHLYLKLETKGPYVTDIWYDVKGCIADEGAALRAAFALIEDIAPSVIADYWENTSGALDDEAFVDHYFTALMG